MKRIIKDALILFAITAVSALLLALVNELTKEPISKQQEMAKEQACKDVFTDAAEFTLREDLTDADRLSAWITRYPKLSCDEVYEAHDASGNILGYVVTITTSEGYGSGITFSMGIKSDRTLNGISILASSETVGLGLEAENVLVPQFANKNVEMFTYTKTGSTSESEIDAISSATITTNAFVNAVNGGLDFFDCYLAGKEDAANEIE